MPGYSDFAFVYDDLMYDVDYKKSAAGLLRLFKKYDRKPTILLDLACGTGSFSYELANNKIDVIGVDCSTEMLSEAESKRQSGENPLFLCQTAEQLDLYGTIDGAICMLDSLNHLADYKALCKALEKVSLFLEKDRLFIFDVNTIYKHRKILADNTFIIENNNIFCAWQNALFGNTISIKLDIFIDRADEGIFRISEEFSETAYTALNLDRAIIKAGLETVDIIDENGQKPQKNAERLIYITRKK